MPYIFNNIECNTFACVDENRTGEPLVLKGSQTFFYVMLLADGEPMTFSPNSSIDVVCYIKEEGNNFNPPIEKDVYSYNPRTGRITMRFPPELKIPGKSYLCEINVINDNFRFKSSSFRVCYVN